MDMDDRIRGDRSPRESSRTRFIECHLSMSLQASSSMRLRDCSCRKTLEISGDQSSGICFEKQADHTSLPAEVKRIPPSVGIILRTI